MALAATQERRPPLTKEEIETVVSGLLSEARTYDEGELAPFRAKATKYYLAEPYGDEEDGRSSVVTTEVREVVRGILPSLLRVCYGPDGAVEFVAPRPDLEQQAKTLTKYIKHVVAQDNPGFLEFHAWFKDAGIRRLGWMKYWWEDTSEASTQVFEGVPAEMLAMLEQNQNVSYTVLDEAKDENGQPVYKCEVTTTTPNGRARFMAVPPEEMLISPSARSVQGATLVAHVRELRISDVVQMGYNLDELIPHSGQSSTVRLTADVLARENDRSVNSTSDDTIDDSTRPIVFTEAYVLLDRSGNGIASRYKIHFVGDTFHMIGEPEPVSRVPFSAICFDPEPHTLIGLGLADDAMDLQLITSHVLRGTLDSLGNTLDPATAFVEGQVEVKDLLNPERGKLIRMRQPGMVQELYHDFVGKEAFPIFDLLDRMKENRTGQSKAAQGLDADALQSSTKQAVAATLAKSQERLELIARIVAETGLKDFYRGLYLLLKEHQDFARTVRLTGGSYLTVNPQDWTDEFELEVRAGLGVGTADEKKAVLNEIAMAQANILVASGQFIGNPLVPLSAYRNTLARMTELAGLNPDEFWGKIDDQQLMQQQASQPPQPSPEMVIAQAQAQKYQAEIAMKQQELVLKERELQLKSQELAMKDSLERTKIDTEATLRRHEIEGKFNIEVSKAEVHAAIEREKVHMNAPPPTMKRTIKVERGSDGKMSQMTSVEHPVTHSPPE